MHLPNKSSVYERARNSTWERIIDLSVEGPYCLGSAQRDAWVFLHDKNFIVSCIGLVDTEMLGAIYG